MRADMLTASGNGSDVLGRTANHSIGGGVDVCRAGGTLAGLMSGRARR